jgi:hypothetical protein
MKDKRIDEILNKGYSLPIGKIINETFRTSNSKLGTYWIFIIIFVICLGLISEILSYLNQIPYVGGPIGNILSLSFLTAFVLGISWHAMKSKINHKVEFKELFNPLTVKYKEIFLCNFIIDIFWSLLFLGLTHIFFSEFSDFFISTLTNGIQDIMTLIKFIGEILARITLFFTGLFISFIIYLFFNTLLTFTYPLVIFTNMPALKAIRYSIMIVLKNFISFFILKFLFWIIWVASLIPFGLGMIWTIPASCVLPFILYDNIIGIYEEDKKGLNDFQGNIL